MESNINIDFACGKIPMRTAPTTPLDQGLADGSLATPQGGENMAIFYMRTSIVRASSGKSAVASAAYQAAEELHNEKLDRTFSYSRKEEVIHSEIMLPDNAPESFHDRATLWNAVEAKESKSNSRYARQFVIATPREWSEAETIERAREFIQTALVDKGMCVDWAFHMKDGNPHIHIMATVRGFNPDGSWATMERKEYALDENGERIPEIDPKTGEQKIRKRTRNGVTSCERIWKRVTVQANNWNKREFLHEVKRAWADQCNRYLPPEQQIDWRSYRDQGINQIPMVHEGPGARAAMQQGIMLDAVRENQERRQLNAALARMEQLILDARKLLEALQQKLIKWRESHGQRKSITADELIRRNGGIATPIPAACPGSLDGAGESRPLQKMIHIVAELEQRTEKIRRHRR